MKDAQTQVTKFISGLWDTIKAKVDALAKEGQGLIPKMLGLDGLGKDKPVIDTARVIEDALKKVDEVAVGAAKTLLDALGLPADAVAEKYKVLFDKLNEQLKLLPVEAKDAADKFPLLPMFRYIHTVAS